MLYPANFEQKIGFDTVRNILKSDCTSTLGKEHIDQIAFTSDFDAITTLLSETQEFIQILTEEKDEFPIGSIFDVRSSLRRIRIEGTFLDEKELFELKNSLETVRSIVLFFQSREEDSYPSLKKKTETVLLLPEIIRGIDAVLDKFGKIKDNASADLSIIRKELRNAQGSVSKTLQNILRKAQIDGYVEKDVTPSLREGRLVIPVSPIFKRKINGIVHDESATGKTVFIEPTAVVEANNRIRELEGEERREIIRILTKTTDFIRPSAPDILSSQSYLGAIDAIRAKATFAIETKSVKPHIQNNCVVEWENARHPILFLSLKKQGRNIVPLNIALNGTQQILIISGPNAGGKSVCLKTVALLQYMLQCGLPIPIDENGTAGIFEQLFIDIGDEQSIENDLSTYSSHLLNMKNFIRHANEKTLLLIDEFGSGTEPQIGGAIAEAVLHNLHQKHLFGVITTHYTNLKRFATETEGVVNAAMLYDRHEMQPLFQLQIGNPGSSFAIEIARKTGLPESVILEASEKVGNALVDFDKYLQDIVRDKRYWENKRQQIRLKEKKTDELLTQYEKELSELNSRQKTILKEAKANAENLLNEANAKIENTIRKIKESQAEKETTKSARTELESFRQETTAAPDKTNLDGKLKNLRTRQKEPVQNTHKQAEKLSIGDSVRLQNQTSIGEILALDNKNATVAFGLLKSKVQLQRLVKVGRSEKRQAFSPQNASTRQSDDNLRQHKLQFKPEIDVRGMRGDEALQAVMYFIDDALMLNVGRVRILHGTGNGILRQLIRDYLSGIGEVTFHDEHIQFGGAGITVVEM